MIDFGSVIQGYYATETGLSSASARAGASRLADTPPRQVNFVDNTPMLDIVLHRPEIPPNTGNVIRLCANTGAHLHLIGPLGFELDDARLKRAGLDYHEYARLTVHEDLTAFIVAVNPRRLFVVSTRGTVRYDTIEYRAGDAVMFGSETSGLPVEVIDSIPVAHRIRLPMRPDNRSLNLSNAVAVVAFEAWRQSGFEGGA